MKFVGNSLEKPQQFLILLPDFSLKICLKSLQVISAEDLENFLRILIKIFQLFFDVFANIPGIKFENLNSSIILIKGSKFLIFRLFFWLFSRRFLLKKSGIPRTLKFLSNLKISQMCH